MKKIVYIVFLFSVIPTYFVYAETFTRSLSAGSIGEDVLNLQRILNTDIETKVATEGVGSVNNETLYFGELTKQAVIKFQNKYASSILVPLGLVQGTGYVGQSTLSFLNSLQNQPQINFESSSVPVRTSSIVQNLFMSDQIVPINTPQFFISKNIAQPEEKIQIGSQTVLKEVKFYIDNDEVPSKCFTEYTCEISIDKKIEAGTYILKTDLAGLGETSITILDSSIEKPEVRLKKLNLSTDNLIKGGNFSSNIKIYTMYGVFTSETKNNSFILGFPSEYANNPAQITEGIFYIENDNGLVSDILNIQYEI